MNSFLLRASALAGATLAFGAMPAGAGQRFQGGPAIYDLRGSHRAGGVAQDPRGFAAERHGMRPVAGRGEGERRFPRYGAGVTRADVAGLRLSHRLGARPYGAGYGDRFHGARYGSAAVISGGYGATHLGYGGGAAPLTVGYGGGFAPSYGTTGNGYGSTGYGYGGDFSTAYTSGYDDFQTVGYATPSGAYGGQGYGAAPSYGAGGYGYGGARGWSPAIPPAGGLAVYSPGAYGPGPRIVTIPSHYTPGGGDSFGCRCPQGRD